MIWRKNANANNGPEGGTALPLKLRRPVKLTRSVALLRLDDRLGWARPDGEIKWYEMGVERAFQVVWLCRPGNECSSGETESERRRRKWWWLVVRSRCRCSKDQQAHGREREMQWFAKGQRFAIRDVFCSIVTFPVPFPTLCEERGEEEQQLRLLGT